MGEVFQGRNLGSGRQVAVKVLRLSHADERVRFEREARMLSEFDHPNIVRHIEHAVDPLGQPYLVMEWLDGEDKLAAGWLEQQGETDPMVLAEHCDRGGEPARAGRFYFQAAERALRAGDTGAVVERAQRALALGLLDAERVILLGLLSEVHVWRSDWEAAAYWGEQAMRLAAPGTDPWARAVIANLTVALKDGQSSKILALTRLLLTVEPVPMRS